MTEPRPPGLRGLAFRVFGRLLPHAERQEVLHDLAAEYAARASARGLVSARVWLWRQLLASLPPLVRRTWWRGWTGFEPRASRFQPGGPVIESWVVDLRYSARRLASRRAYTVLAVLTLGLGVAGTAAVFSVVRALLLDPLPIAREADVGVFWLPGGWTEEEFLHLRPHFQGFEGVAAYKAADGATLERPREPLRLLSGLSASAELFDVLGARPLLGRTFEPHDDRLNADPVVVVSHDLWQELGSDPSLVDRHLVIGGTARRVIGVMPPGFWFPSPTTDVWLSRSLDPERRVGELELVGRVAPGHRLESMDGPLSAIAARLGERFRYPSGEWDKLRNPSVTPLREYLVGDVRPGLVATFVSVGLILLIACVNVAVLMLGQVGGRSSEMAVRAALGADRGRLLQQLVIEAMLLGAVAGVAGALLAAAGFRVLLESLPLGALAETAAIDWRLFLVALLVAAGSGVLTALVPALALWRTNLRVTLAATRTTGASTRGGRLEGGLVVAQIALAVLLSVGAGLLIRSVANLRAIDPGVNPAGVAVIDVTVPTQLSTDDRRRAYLEALPALRALPGVRSAAATQRLPLRGSSDNWGVEVRERPDIDGTTAFRLVTHDYLETLGIAVRRGRGFLVTDRAGTERVVLVNEALAAKYFGSEDPLGRVLHTGFDKAGERIVGLVENVAEANLTDPPLPVRYMLYDQVPDGIMPATTLVLRAASPSDLPAVIQSARTTLARVAPRIAVERVTTLQFVFDKAVGPAGQVVTLVSILAALALLLGAIGVYGMVSHFVARRTRDYGICLALGLPPARVVSQVVGRGIRLVGAGVIAGIAAALVVTRLLSSMLYGVTAADPLALAGAILALLGIGTAAAYVPARRASRTDPAVVLREQ